MLCCGRATAVAFLESENCGSNLAFMGTFVYCLKQEKDEKIKVGMDNYYTII